MKQVMIENEQLKSILESQGNDQERAKAELRMKKQVKALQEEVKFLTKINHAQSEKISRHEQDTCRTARSSNRRALDKSKSVKRRAGGTRKNSEAGDDRSRSFVRDCCLQKQLVIERESQEQLHRIRSKHSPMNSTQRMSNRESGDFSTVAASRTIYSRNAVGTSVSSSGRQRSRTPNKSTVSIKKIRKNTSTTKFDPLPSYSIPQQ